MSLTLQVTDGPGVGRSFTFDKYGVLLLGRSKRCHCCVGDDLECSRVHLLVEVNPPNCSIRDLGSKNGTFVNENRVVQAAISPGDVVRIGITRFSIAGEGGDRREAEPSVYDRCVRCTASLSQSPIPVCPECEEEMREIGEDLPGFRLLRRINDGAMGTILLAEETRTGRQVAVKLPIPDFAVENPLAIPMFVRECVISMGLEHPRIVEFLRAGEYRGQLYIAMEYVNGEDVLRLLERSGPMSERDVINIGLQVLEALSYAHSQGIVHRDLKPQNIMLTGQAPDYQIKVTDFGLAKNFRDSGLAMNLTRVGDRRGTVFFMPPEQVVNSGGVDHRADIFSLGATMYYMLCVRPVFDFQEGTDPYLQIVESDVVPLERRGGRVSPELAQVINRSVQKDPSQRYQSAEEMSRALRMI